MNKNDLIASVKSLQQALVFFVGFFLLSTAANAGVYSFTGKIDILRTHDKELFPDHDWMSITGFVGAGSCDTYQGAVVIAINNSASSDGGDAMYRNILIAKATDAVVNLSVDDSHVRSGGHCYVRHFEID